MNLRSVYQRHQAAVIVTSIAFLLCCSAAFAQSDAAPSRPALPKNFFARFGDFYRQDWAVHSEKPGVSAPSSTPAPARRGLPSPLDSPPFPNSDWSYGGSPVIGEPDGQTYPLMSALNGARSRIKLYGWLDPSINYSTSSESNAPVANDVFANRPAMQQVVVYLERLPDSVQRDHIDWGFHLTALYGSDYRFTTSKGYFSGQLLDHNRSYGFDPALEYVDVYFPKVAQGMNIRAGRYISIPGIEAQLAPNNYTFSHSLLYAIDPFTDTGILATIKLSNQWLIQTGISAGHDIAPWASGAKPSATACVSYTTKSVDDNFYICANGINNGLYAYNNMQQYDATWYHRFSRKFHMATETWYMYERGVPSVDGTIMPENGTNGAFCHPGLQRCTAPEYAAVNFLQDELTTHTFLTLRTDFLNDQKGQRTGYQGRYGEETLSVTHWIGTTVQFRPELRFDHAFDQPAYGNGQHRNQLTLASDVIFHF